jgi:hypothetical protein
MQQFIAMRIIRFCMLFEVPALSLFLQQLIGIDFHTR